MIMGGKANGEMSPTEMEIEWSGTKRRRVNSRKDKRVTVLIHYNQPYIFLKDVHIQSLFPNYF